MNTYDTPVCTRDRKHTSLVCFRKLKIHLDYYSHYIHHNYMSVFPDSILRFGARSNSGMIKDSLFVSMYVYSMPIKKGEKIVDINAEIEKLKKGKKKVMKGWRSLYCSPR